MTEGWYFISDKDGNLIPQVVSVPEQFPLAENAVEEKTSPTESPDEQE